MYGIHMPGNSLLFRDHGLKTGSFDGLTGLKYLHIGIVRNSVPTTLGSIFYEKRFFFTKKKLLPDVVHQEVQLTHFGPNLADVAWHWTCPLFRPGCQRCPECRSCPCRRPSTASGQVSFESCPSCCNSTADKKI